MKMTKRKDAKDREGTPRSFLCAALALFASLRFNQNT